MQLGHPPGHGESEAGPPGAVGAEPLEDAVAVLRRHSPAGVDDLEPPRAAVGPAVGAGRDADGRLGGRVARRVVHHVDQQLAQPGRVAGDHEVVGDVHRDVGGPAGGAHLGDDVLDERAQRHVLAVQVDHARLEAGELEQVLDQPTQALRLLERAAEVLGVGGHHTVGEVLEQGGHRRERRTQLVGDRGDEVAPLAVHPREVLRHPVEGGGELADLVGRRRAHTSGVVAARHRSRHLGHPPQRGDHAGGQQLRHAQRERDADRQHEQRRDVGGGAQQGQQDRGDDRRDHQQAELGLEAGDGVEPGAHARSSRA